MDLTSQPSTGSGKHRVNSGGRVKTGFIGAHVQDDTPAVKSIQERDYV